MTMWMNSAKADWYIGFLTTFDQTKVFDDSTFLNLVDTPSVFQEMRNYSVVLLDDSTDSGKRVHFIADEIQVTDNQISGLEDTSLMRIQNTLDASQFIVGMFLCTREANDDEYCILYSVGSCVPAVTIYPNEILQVNYTPGYQ